MEKFYSNKKRILFIKFDQEVGFLPVGYLLANNFDEAVEMLPTTTSQNQEGWVTARPLGMQSYKIDFSALQVNTIFAGGDFTRVSYDRLKLIKRSRKVIDWRLITTDLQFVDYGKGYITQLTEPTETVGLLKYNATMIGYGKPDFTSERPVILNTGIPKEYIEDGNDNLINP